MLQFASGYLTAILPCLSYNSEQRRSIQNDRQFWSLNFFQFFFVSLGIREVAQTLNYNLMKLVTNETPDDDKFVVSWHDFSSYETVISCL